MTNININFGGTPSGPVPVFEFDREKHQYFLNKQELPSVTKVCKVVGIIYERGFASEEEMWLGSASHKAIELYLKGTLNEKTLDDRLKPRLDAYREFESTTGFKAVQVEVPMYHPVAKVAGTPDIVGYFPSGGVGIIDEKNGVVKPATAIQTAGYQFILNSGKVPTRRFGLRLKPDGRPIVQEFPDPADLHTFVSALNCYNWIRNHGGRL